MEHPSPTYELSEAQKYFERLLLSGEYSDLKIFCQDITFNVHQCIICPQSSFFRAAIEHPFKESSTRVIELPADHPGTVERMISYLYLKDYRQTGHIIPMAAAEDEDLAQVGLNHADVYITADKYDIQLLKSLAATKMTSWAKSNFKSPGFVDMARHILQMKHDAWPCEFIGKCIKDNLRNLTRDDAEILKLIGDFGLLGGAILMGLLESDMLRDTRLEAENAREKRRLQDEVATLKRDNAALKNENSALKRNITTLQRWQGGLHYREGDPLASEGSFAKRASNYLEIGDIRNTYDDGDAGSFWRAFDK
ncbi:uncharacterized protein N7496_003908 [Penicillium cataractarum]|uniref:BTB domain-containing protein n=1 Tax=Penicillium cataractarum TaxID=2100454 RepID=A0A9W9SNZ4_9EURO|nr:uncharacterized protein N7496_003908 [Penicillium cataractarum]KAJ5381480.1 hypothetical protein N7496_003908 [Penicillium cataractarum]